MPAIKYNAGDFVVVNEDVQEGCNYGDCYVTRQMANLAGCVVQITSCPKENTYTVDETDEWGYVWTGEMFSGLAGGEQYAVGDVVYVREDLCEGRDYRMFNSSRVVDVALGTMLKLAGRAVTIEEITPYGKYHIKESDSNWTDEMFSGLAKDFEPSTDEDMMSLFGIQG